jgi:DNA-binding transcriptional LysR family regulator
VKTIEAGGIDQCASLRRGELDAAVAVREGNEAEFVAHAISLVRFRIVYNPRSGITLNKTVEVRDLTGVPLLLLRPGFGSRRMFDAACRLERIVPDVFLESTATETLLALAREGHGAAIIPTTAVRIDGKSLRLAPLMFRRKPLAAELAVLWHRERRPPRYAEASSAAFAGHMRELMPDLSQRMDRYAASPRARPRARVGRCVQREVA